MPKDDGITEIEFLPNIAVWEAALAAFDDICTGMEDKDEAAHQMAELATVLANALGRCVALGCGGDIETLQELIERTQRLTARSARGVYNGVLGIGLQ